MLSSAEITPLTKEQRMENAAKLLLADYENDEELTDLTAIDSDDFYQYDLVGKAQSEQ